MTELNKQVRRVCRRLNFQRFLDILVWCWVAALVLDLGWVAAEKYWQPLIEPWWISTLAALGLGAVAAGLITVFTRRSPVEAAMALDQAFGLKERVSSTITLPEELRESSAGIALISDTAKRIESLDVGEKFGFQIPRTAWLPVLPAVLVFLVASFVHLAKSGVVQAKPSSDEERKAVQESTKVLAKRLEEQKEKAKEQGMEETGKLLAELSKKANEDLANNKEIDQKQALSKLNELQDSIKGRREKLGTAEQLQKQFEKLKATMEQGPADELHKALKQGDMTKAVEALSKLANDLKTGKLDEAQRKALEKQLAQMKEQLKKLGDMQERRKQLEQQLKQAGMSDEQIKKELAKLDAQAKQLEKISQLAEKLGQCQESLSKGDTEKALESLNLSKADLQQLMQELQELDMLQKALDDLADMKNAMVCKNCAGAG